MQLPSHGDPPIALYAGVEIAEVLKRDRNLPENRMALLKIIHDALSKKTR
jgi:hypothetical protein